MVKEQLLVPDGINVRMGNSMVKEPYTSKNESICRGKGWETGQGTTTLVLMEGCRGICKTWSRNINTSWK